MIFPYIKLFAVFALMFIGLRLRLSLGVCALIGSFIMALLFGIGPLEWYTLALSIFSESSMIIVWAIIICVLSLSSFMESSKQAERFMTALSRKVTSPRIRMVLFPIIIGLLPVPGGAVFSAPMISAVAKELPMAEQSKSDINYWFRHTGEMSWPLFPGLILAASIGGVTTPNLVLWTFPISIAYFAIGWFFFVRSHNIPTLPTYTHEDTSHIWHTIVKEGAPLIIAIVGALFLEVCFAYFLPQIPMDYAIIVALVCSVFCCLLQNKLGAGDLLQTLLKPNVRSMLFMIGALGVFKNVIIGGGIVQHLLSKDVDLIALWLCATVLPMSIGMLTGLMIVGVGAAFPLLVALVEVSNAGSVIPWLMLGLVSNHVGAMISPLHICLVLSCEYFKVNVMHSVKKMIVPSVCLFLAGVGYYFVLIHIV